MKGPRTRNEQRMAHCRGEVHRGCGVWPFLGLGSPLEPPFEPYSRSAISEWDLTLAGYDAPYQGQFIDRLKRLFVPARAMRSDLRAGTWRRTEPLELVSFRLYREDEATPTSTEQLLLA